MPVSMPSPRPTSMMTVSISTCESLMSIDSMICSSVGTSSFCVMTTRPLMRLSWRTVVFSFESSPALTSPVRWLADFFAADVPPVGVLRVRLPPDPCLAFWFWFALLDPFDDGALPMRSLIMSETSSARAYLRRYTFTTVSGVVSTSSCSMTLSKKSMFDFIVTMISLFDRSSARISTLPRIMPRSASETFITSDWLLADAAAGWLPFWPGRRSMLPRSGGRGALFCCCAWFWFTALPFFSCSFCDSCTIASSAILMSWAEAFFTWRTNTFSRTGVATSTALAISSMRLMFCSVSVTRIELVRSNTSSTPSLDLSPSSTFCASSVAMFLNGIIIDTVRLVSPTFVSESMMSGMPPLRTSLRGSARTKLSPYGSR